MDVQDLWPESFTIALGNSVVSRIIMLPLKRIVNDAYKKSDVVIAVSDTYVKRALLNMNSKPYYSIYLGTDGNSVERALMEESETIKSEDEFAIGYIGNIGASYDFLHVFEALSLLKKKGYNNIKFHIFGDGNYRNQVEEYIKKYFSNVYIYGYLPYIEMIKLCRQCDMVLNPIIAGTASSVINKVGDYAAMGIAVVNTQDNMEYRELVEKYNAGFNSVPENSESIAECIEKLYLDKKLCSEMGKNNRKMFNDLFDRSKTYKIIVDCIERN
ncbi:MAG: glycosyltransferase [Coprobacillus cateniformis]